MNLHADLTALTSPESPSRRVIPLAPAAPPATSEPATEPDTHPTILLDHLSRLSRWAPRLRKYAARKSSEATEPVDAFTPGTRSGRATPTPARTPGEEGRGWPFRISSLVDLERWGVSTNAGGSGWWSGGGVKPDLRRADSPGLEVDLSEAFAERTGGSWSASEPPEDKGAGLFLDYYSSKDLIELLEKKCVLKALEKKGYKEPALVFDTSDDFQHRLSLVDASLFSPTLHLLSTERFLIDLYMKRRTDWDLSSMVCYQLMLRLTKAESWTKLKEMTGEVRAPYVGIEGAREVVEFLEKGLEEWREMGKRRGRFDVTEVVWMQMHDPLAKTSSRPLLPGQRFPGLGLGRQVGDVMESMALNSKVTDALLNFPFHYHIATAYYHRGYLHLDPIYEAYVHFLQAQLAPYTAQHGFCFVSWAVSMGFLRRVVEVKDEGTEGGWKNISERLERWSPMALTWARSSLHFSHDLAPMSDAQPKKKGGGSALKQLKTSLASSGLSRTSQPKDPKKRQKLRKQLSSNSRDHRSAKLEAIGKDFNKFDSREENKKFEVVTRAGRAEEGRKGAPGKSRAAGVELRKKTLLPLLQSRNHTSSFVDRRFGENSTTLTPEEKALERFTAERTSRLGKKARFNLEDDDEIGLTHGGQKLGFGDEDELEAGGWGGLGAAEEGGASSSNREPLLRRRMAAVAGEQEDGEEEPPRKRSRAEIMDEVIAKSKMYKHERQKAKSADEETRFELDEQLKDLRMMLGGSGRMPRPAEAGGKAVKSAEGDDDDDEEEEEEEGSEDEDEDEDEDEEDSEEGSEDESETEELDEAGLEAALAAAGKSGVDKDLLRKLIGKLAEDSGSEDEAEEDAVPAAPVPAFDATSTERPAPAPVEPKDADPYDSYVRMLALEPRAHATDRMKTPLELAKDAAEDLRKQEEARLRRQRGEDDPEDEEEGKKGKKDKGKRKPQGDDLDDDYLMEEYGSDAGVDEEVEEEGGLGKGLEGGFGGQVIASDEGEEEEDEEEEGSESEEEEGSEEEEEEEEESEEEIDLEDESEEEIEGAQEDLVAALPASKPVAGKAELPFTFPCPSTHAEFAKLLTQSGIPEEDTATVVKRIRVLYHPGLGEANKGKLQVFTNVLLDHVLHLAALDTPTSYKTINSLLPQLLTLSHAFPLTTAPYYVTKLGLMQKNFLRGIARGPLDPTSKTWPGPAELTLLRLVGMVWSTSDLSHPVAAAAMLLIGQYLAQARIRSLADVASGLFLCTLAAQYETLSKRLVPESLNFLLNAFLLIVPTSITTKSVPGSFPSPDLGQEHVKSLRLRTTENLQPRKLKFSASIGTKSNDNQTKIDLVATMIALLKDLAEKYVSKEAFIELFKPTEVVLEKINFSKAPPVVKTLVEDLQSSVARMLKLATSSRKPLILQHHKPIPIATYIPKFDEGYNPNRKFDPDTERAEASKVRALYKKEKKGAIRELRKDNKFLAAEEQKIRAQKDQDYGKKIARIMGSISDERAEEKAHYRAKEKGKRMDKKRRN
ncbi:nucleolar protein 14 [Pseudohyphozyma bogoriensis]|nr:nucleolar protein 14 [Pseudohyphozyma bogoriensis]